MFEDSRESHSFFAIKYEDSFEEVIQIGRQIFESLLFSECVGNTKGGCATTVNFRFHIMS